MDNTIRNIKGVGDKNVKNEIVNVQKRLRTEMFSCKNGRFLRGY